MYGVLVGKVMTDVDKGGALTVENVKHQASKATAKTEDFKWNAPDVSKWKDRTFMGYHRADGQVGTANVWLFFPLVFCENRNIELLKEVFEQELSVKKGANNGSCCAISSTIIQKIDWKKNRFRKIRFLRM